MFRKLKDRIHAHVKRQKKPIVILMILLLLDSVGYAVAVTYWQRQITYNFSVVGINAEILNTGPDNYGGKAVASQLSASNQIQLVIYQENFHSIWLNLTWTSNALGFQVSATGQYLSWYHNPYTWWESTPNGDVPDLMGYHVIDKTKMIWGDPSGGALLITFSFNSELVTTPGSYAVILLFQMGFV